jgi:DNA-binding MarR family transcriptional regulator
MDTIVHRHESSRDRYHPPVPSPIDPHGIVDVLAAPGPSDELFAAIEIVIFGAIGVTSVAIAEVAPGELTLHQWRALVVIGRAGTIRVGEVARQIGTALPATSRLLLRLERRGYLVPARDERDRRATIVRLTEFGERVRDSVIARRRALIQAALTRSGEPLPADLAGGLAALGKAFAPYT